MNFKHMSALEWEFSYPMVIGFVVEGSTLQFWRSKRARWL